MKKKNRVITRRQVFADPIFELTRQNNAEFSRACTANRLLRQAFVQGLRNKTDRYVSGRLTKRMFNILQCDQANERGKRRVPQGVPGILEGFNFNRDTSLQNVLWAPSSVLFNEAAMLITIHFPLFISNAMIETASGGNAFMLTALAASVHFEKESFPVKPVQTGILDISLFQQKNLRIQLPVNDHQPDHTIIVGLGIEFFHDKRGSIEPVDKKHNAMAVVKVF